MPLQPPAPHGSPLMPNAMRNSSLSRRMTRGARGSETVRGGAANRTSLR